jgi:hypothetical protein
MVTVLALSPVLRPPRSGERWMRDAGQSRRRVMTASAMITTTTIVSMPLPMRVFF